MKLFKKLALVFAFVAVFSSCDEIEDNSTLHIYNNAETTNAEYKDDVIVNVYLRKQGSGTDEMFAEKANILTETATKDMAESNVRSYWKMVEEGTYCIKIDLKRGDNTTEYVTKDADGNEDYREFSSDKSWTAIWDGSKFYFKN